MAAKDSKQSDTPSYKIPSTDLTTEFPPRMGRISRRELALAGYTRFEDLTKAKPQQLLEIHGVGQKAIDILREELGDRGMSFADGS